MDNFCIFMTRTLETERQYSDVLTIPQQIEGEVIVIPHSYCTEEEVFKDDLQRLCQNNAAVREAIETGTNIQVEYSLAQINDIIPRKRIRSDAYTRFQRYLLTKGIELKIYSRKKQKAEA